MSEQETGWAAQRMGMPARWYDRVSAGSGAEFPVSGDATAARVGMRRAVLITRGDGAAPVYWPRARLDTGPFVEWSAEAEVTITREGWE